VKPLIAVAGRLGPAGRVSRDAVVFAGRRCLDAILRAGGEPVLLAPQPLTHTVAMGLLRRFDGLLLMGGADVDPRRYGAEPHAAVYGVNPEHDDFELALAEAAMTLELPTLALCRGMQVTNVAANGTLLQHLGDVDNLLDHGPPTGAGPTSHGVLHTLDIRPGTRLAAALGPVDHPVGNSFHHQAVDEVGAGFSIAASSSDGVVEAIEHDRGWYVCVQWHPEDTAMRDPVQQRLFDAFVEQARER
jgi:putative glutamine amidotransferase